MIKITSKIKIMIAVASQMLLTDGDAAFIRVNNRVPAHALQPGEVAGALNCRFDRGKPGPRYGVASDDWGKPGAFEILPSNATLDGTSHYQLLGVLTVGRTYRFRNDSGFVIGLTILSGTTPVETGPVLSGTTFEFVSNGDGVDFFATHPGERILGSLRIVPRDGIHTCAYKRFSDPDTDTDNTVLITDDWRDGTGEDGGRGRAWRIRSGNVPAAIPLNGHDIWGTARLVQCDTALLLLRHGNQRYYFSASAVNDATNDRIQLNVAPPWPINSALRVRFELAAANSAIYGSAPPAAGNYYYARHISGDKVELYTDAGLTNKLDYAASPAPAGRFYLEEADNPEPFFGNFARNLILQPDGSGATGFDAGFDWVVANVEITNTVAATDILTAPNHRLQPGDSVTGTAIGGVTWPKFAAPQSDHTLKLYDSADDAQIDGGTTGLVNLTTDGQTGTLWKTSAASVPLPPCREGAYVNGRFIGINGRDRIVISDPGDFLHCTIWQSVLPANQSEAGQANWLVPLGNNVVAVGKDLNVIGIAGLSGSPSGWTERNITTEYNGLAALAALQIGTDVWFASRKGYASVIRTVAGETLGTARTVSHSIPDYLKDIDWSRANLMCAETWNNRLFWSVPLRGQDTPANNHTLVLNFLNSKQRVDQNVVAGDIIGGVVETDAGEDAWEGAWSGDLLTPYAYAKLTVNGEERLTFATPDGLVCWLHDGWDDAGENIASEILTRGYFGGRPVLALRGKLNHDTFQPSITASLVSAGVNEETPFAGFDPLTYDRTKYVFNGVEDYDPATATEAQFNARGREDYSPADTDLSVATLDVHQNLTEPFYCRERCTAPQVRYVNAQGSARLCAVSMQAKPIGLTGRET